MSTDMTAREVCKYLGIHKQSLEKYQRAGKLEPSYQFPNGERMYTREDVDAYKAKWQSPMWTLQEISFILKVADERVKYAFRRKRSIQPDAHRGRFATYGDSKVLMVARSEKWITYYRDMMWVEGMAGILRLEADEKYYVFARSNGVLDLLGSTDDLEVAEDMLLRLMNSQLEDLRTEWGLPGP